MSNVLSLPSGDHGTAGVPSVRSASHLSDSGTLLMFAARVLFASFCSVTTTASDDFSMPGQGRGVGSSALLKVQGREQTILAGWSAKTGGSASDADVHVVVECWCIICIAGTRGWIGQFVLWRALEGGRVPPKAPAHFHLPKVEMDRFIVMVKKPCSWRRSCGRWETVVGEELIGKMGSTMLRWWLGSALKR